MSEVNKYKKIKAASKYGVVAGLLIALGFWFSGEYADYKLGVLNHMKLK